MSKRRKPDADANGTGSVPPQADALPPEAHPSRVGMTMAEVVAEIADIFCEDMLRLEREHGLDAKQMLAYYRHELELPKPEAGTRAEGGKQRA